MNDLRKAAISKRPRLRVYFNKAAHNAVAGLYMWYITFIIYRDAYDIQEGHVEVFLARAASMLL